MAKALSVCSLPSRCAGAECEKDGGRPVLELRDVRNTLSAGAVNEVKSPKDVDLPIENGPMAASVTKGSQNPRLPEGDSEDLRLGAHRTELWRV